MAASCPSTPPSAARALAGGLLVRLVVPAWIALGVGLELVEVSPATLPKTLRLLGHHLGLDPFVWLATLTALEILAVAVLLLVRPLARPMAVFMLASFCLILVGEMLAGNFTSCGCFGALSVAPWITLSIDAALLVAVLVVPPRRAGRGSLRPGPVMAAILVSLAGAAVVALRVLPAGAPAYAMVATSVVAAAGPEGGTEAIAGAALPEYYEPDVATWIDRPFAELDLARWMPPLPEAARVGPAYVIFYGRTCDHCHDLMRAHFTEPAGLPPTLAVAVPETPVGFTTRGARPLACDACLRAELPVGPDWMITPPLVLALDDGVVVCAVEAESVELPACLLWHD